MCAIEIKDPKFLRERYFDQPLQVIEHGGDIPGGNGAIIALMAVFPLYERYIDDSTPDGLSEEDAKLFKKKFRARDLGLSDDPTTDADQFWNVFRDGLGHSAMFFEESTTARMKRNNWVLPKVSIRKGDGYPPLPVFRTTKAGERVICLDPWGFVAHVLSKYKADPEIFIRDTESPLLSLFLIPPEEIAL